MLPMIPVVKNCWVSGWPRKKEGEDLSVARYLSVDVMLNEPFYTDAHFMSYSVPDLPYRMKLESLDKISSIPMVLFVLDVDDPHAHQYETAARETWREEEKRKVEALFSSHSGGYYYESRKGYRLLYQDQYQLSGPGASAEWRHRYYQRLCYFARRFGIIADPACSDWTRLYRTPHATRDEGAAPENRPSLGDASQLALLELPQGEERDDLETASLLAGQESFRSWERVKTHFTPKAPPKAPGEPKPVLLRSAPALSLVASPALVVAQEEARPGLVASVSRGYALAALEAEIEALSHATEGRTDVLKLAAIKLYSLAKSGALARSEVDARLRGALAANGWTAEYDNLERQLGNFWNIAKPRDLSRVGKGEEEPDSSNEGWETKVLRDKNGRIKASLPNLIRILRSDPAWRGTFGRNLFSDAIEWRRVPARWPVDAPEIGSPFAETDTHHLVAWLSDHLGTDWTLPNAFEAVRAVAELSTHHPVRDYLAGLRWDGLSRLDSWLSNYLGVEVSAYSQAAGAAWMISAVARVLNPGCKADCMLILEGPQGKKKSTALQVLASAAWFLDHPRELGDKDTAQQIQGRWIVEFAELDQFTRATASKIKSYLSQQRDIYRPPYGRVTQERARQCVFAGTCNGDEYLKDETGGRRFWPVQVQDINIEKLKQDRDQLWAEALVRFYKGERWWLEGEALEQSLDEQSARYQGDPWSEAVAAWALGRDSVTISQVLREALQIPESRQDRAAMMRVSSILKTLKMVRRQTTEAGIRVWRYFPSSVHQPAPTFPI